MVAGSYTDKNSSSGSTGPVQEACTGGSVATKQVKMPHGSCMSTRQNQSAAPVDVCVTKRSEAKAVAVCSALRSGPVLETVRQMLS